MFVRLIQFVLIVSTMMIGVGIVSAQRGADNKAAFTKPCERADISKFEDETCVKMRIAKETKDFNDMLKRGDEVRQLSERLVRSFELNGSLSDGDRDLLETLEKNVKKIRDGLGGDGDDEKIDDVLGPEIKPTLANAIEKLKTSVPDLCDELKKTTRFSISAIAIENSNDVLTLARFLRTKN